MWFIYALSSALLMSFRKVNDKHLSSEVHHLHLAWMSRFAALPVLGILALVFGQFLPSHELSQAFWISIIFGSFIATPLDTAIYLQTLQHGQLSKTAPLQSLRPAIMLILGAVFLGQIPSLIAVCAILVIIIGVYTLNTSRDNRNILFTIWQDRGTRFGLIGVGTVSLTVLISAIGVSNSEPLFYAFWANVGSAITQFICAQIFAPGKFRNSHKIMIAQNGVIQGSSSALYFSAVAVGPIGYVTAIISLTAIFSAILGARIFNEGMDRRKIVSLCLIGVGVLVLGLGT